MELISKQNNPTNSSCVGEVEKLTEMVSQELVNVLTVIIGNCDQMVMRLKKDEPLYSQIKKFKCTAEHTLYLNSKLLSLNRDNHVARIDAITKNDEK
jgi:predicted phosphodiesterase